MFTKKNIIGVGFTNASKESILEYIVKNLKNNQKKYYIVTPNPELLLIAYRNLEYKKVLNGAKLALADGIGIILAGKLLSRDIKERITGVDLVEDLCRRIAEKPITIGFLGGGPGVAERTAECLRKKYPGLKVGFAQEEWINELFLPSSERKVDVLFVAFGSPKQEIWISKNLNKLPVKVAIGVGGAFDFISGKVKRAPVWMRRLGLEWLFRLIAQPWRIKRQLSLPLFVLLVLKERFVNKE